MPKGVHNGPRLGRTRTSLKERFATKYIPEPNSGCWLWISTMLHNGYGTIRNEQSKFVYAHRVSVELSGREIPDGYYVCHRCDNKICVNPDHLYVGTPSDNQYDRWRSHRRRINCHG